MSTTKIEIPGWSAYPLTVTEECAPGGSGQCDGHDYDDPGADCECPCHRMDLGVLNVPQVEKWHQILHQMDGTESNLSIDQLLIDTYVLLRIALDDSVNHGSLTDSEADAVERRFIAALENQED